MSFERELDALLSLHDAKVCAEVDAGACQTDWDRHKAREASDRYMDAYDRLLARYGEAEPRESHNGA